MCGIVGFVSPHATLSPSEAARTVGAMTRSLSHRGPDAEGTWLSPDGAVALGHRRLAVIDLSPAGVQPMHSPSGRFSLVFNGEIYNFHDLRRDLELRGHSFRGASDTEVILAGFDAWGVMETLRRVEGMLAIAAWDAESRTFWLARDRIGEKPLAWGWVGDSLVFASEVRAFRRFPGFAGAVDPIALDAYFRYLCVPGALSIYQGIQKVRPGTAVEVRTSGPEVTVTEHEYYDQWSALREARAEQGEWASAKESFEGALRQAIARQLVADVPLGIFLSGGTDSSTVALLAQTVATRPIHTFSMGNVDPAYDEAPQARRIAKALGTVHEEAYVGEADALAVVASLGSIYDEPFADSSQIPTVLVSRLARKQVTVVLGGDGGDELLGGYPKYRKLPVLWNRLNAVPRVLRASAGHLAAGAGRHAPGRLARLGRRYAGPLLAREFGAFAEEMAMSWRTPPMPRTTVDSARAWWACPRDVDLAPAEALMQSDLRGYLPDDLLVKVDRAAMSVGLEVRLPFLDPGVIAAAWRLPPASRGPVGPTKAVLKELLLRRLPAEIVNAPKRGFSVPLGWWLTGPLHEWAADTVSAGRSRFSGMLDMPAVERQLRAQEAHPDTGNHRLWAYLMFNAWTEAAKLDRAPQW